MNNLAKRETWAVSFPRNRWTGLVKTGALIAGGYVALKITFGLLGFAWTIASWLFWPVTIIGLAYFAGKKYLGR
ncbi:MAG: hypothetical protein HYX20_00695 [Candidatus Yanofskybacteria bacterium]|nr:hypothetical protein [Candidatus Yanofskybacteria bacterium]